MSTRNVRDEALANRAAAVALADAAEARAKEIRAEQKANADRKAALDKERDRVLLGTTIAFQSITDDKAAIDEENEDLTEELMQLDPRNASAPAPAVLTDPLPPADPPTSQLPPTPPAPAPGTTNLVGWMRDRPWWWWLVAIVLGLVMLTQIWPLWTDWPVHKFNVHWLSEVVKPIWAIVHFGVGFFVGGFIAYRIERRQRRGH